MHKEGTRHRILILGGSGFIGHAFYKELHPFFDVHCTYCKQEGNFKNNHVFHHYDVENDDISLLLNELAPSVIVSALKGNYEAQLKAQDSTKEYLLENPETSLFYISSHKVFDAKWQLPSYENDLVLSETQLGKFKIAAEKILLENVPAQTTILRLPIVLGVNSPSVFHLRQCIKHQATFEVFPNLVITATTVSKVCQQLHYLINHSLRGIYHLASNDMVHHEDLFLEITEKISDNMPIFKSVYSSNEDRYLAILPKKNRMPKEYQITIAEVIEESTLNQEIVSIR